MAGRQCILLTRQEEKHLLQRTEAAAKAKLHFVYIPAAIFLA